VDRPSQQVNPKALTRTAIGTVHAAGPSTGHILATRRPAIDRFCSRIALDHKIVVIARMVGQGLYRREVARSDPSDRRDGFRKVPPMHRFRVCRYEAMIDQEPLPMRAVLRSTARRRLQIARSAGKRLV
jgi:hypothetical protein